MNYSDKKWSIPEILLMSLFYILPLLIYTLNSRIAALCQFIFLLVTLGQIIFTTYKFAIRHNLNDWINMKKSFIVILAADNFIFPFGIWITFRLLISTIAWHKSRFEARSVNVFD